jgi:sortase A
VRRQLGLGLVITGGLLLSFAGGQYALGAVRADRARAAWDTAAASRAVAASRRAVSEPGGQRLTAHGAPVAHLVIPSIGLDEIVLEGVDANALNSGPGHVPGSALPGERGNSVISAHRDRHFSGFGSLKIGDLIETESASHDDRWRITALKVIDKDSPALFTTTDATLTLTTCWPIRFLGTAPERLIITAKPVRS